MNEALLDANNPEHGTAKQKISWDSCTWSGARREQLRRWSKLTLREKLQAVEAMGRTAALFAGKR